MNLDFCLFVSCLPYLCLIFEPLEFFLSVVRYCDVHLESAGYFWILVTIPNPLPSPSSAFSLSQHQDLFKRVGLSYQVARVLELQFQHQSFQ